MTFKVQQHNSPYKDTNVTDIEGIVTHVVDANNFYMQDPKPDNDNEYIRRYFSI